MVMGTMMTAYAEGGPASWGTGPALARNHKPAPPAGLDISNTSLPALPPTTTIPQHITLTPHPLPPQAWRWRRAAG